MFTSSHAADSERADISNRPNFAHEQCRSVHLRGWVRKWLHQVVWERVAGIAAHGNVYARFPVPVRGERYRDGFVAHIRSSVIVSLLKKSWSHSPEGSCSRYGAAKTCQRGPKGPGCSFSKMCERQKQTCGMSSHKSRSFVHMFAGPCCVALSTVHCSRNFIDSIRPSVLVKVSCKLCRLVPFLFCSVQCFRSSVQGHDSSSGSMDWM